MCDASLLGNWEGRLWFKRQGVVLSSTMRLPFNALLPPTRPALPTPLDCYEKTMSNREDFEAHTMRTLFGENILNPAIPAQ